MGPRSKASDEVFCRECGERIKQTAEICHHCGVRNAARSTPSQRGAFQSHDPDQYDTIVSENWWYVLLVGLVLQAFTGLYNADGLLMDTIVTAGWLLPPIGLFVDARYVRANSRWNPSLGWTIAGIFPFIALIAGTMYLYRRHTFLHMP